MCERAQLHRACKRVKHQSYRSEVLSGVVRGSNSSDSGLAADHSSGETVSTGRSGSSSLSRETSVEVLSSASENSERRDRSELSRESEDRVTVIQELDELDDLIEGGVKMNKWRVKCVIEALDGEILMRVIEAWEVLQSAVIE